MSYNYTPIHVHVYLCKYTYVPRFLPVCGIKSCLSAVHVTLIYIWTRDRGQFSILCNATLSHFLLDYHTYFIPLQSSR